MSREEAIRILVTHPAVVEVLDAPQPGEPDSGMLMLRLEDEQVIGIDPRLAEPAHTDEPEAARIARVHRAVDVMSASGEAGEKDLETVVPLVRSADYFVAQGQLAPAAVGWLTEFIGFGLASRPPSEWSPNRTCRATGSRSTTSSSRAGPSATCASWRRPWPSPRWGSGPMF